MAENFENYSEVDWANDFLIEAQKQLSKDVLARFRGLLDVNNIQKEEAWKFLDAYKKGDETLKKFLENRASGQKERELSTPLPKKKTEEVEKEQHKTAA